MELTYDSFKSGFKKINTIKIREGTKRETKVSIGTWNGQHVALKSTRKELELKIYKKIPPHPHIVGLIGVMHVKHKNRYHMLMEANACGCDLSDEISCEGKKNIEEALNIMVEITSGIDHLHQCGLIHHDVKKSNVLMMDDGTCAVCDFGLSEFANIQGHGNPRYRINGTPGYRAPEQDKTSSLPITQKIDIYALGKIGKDILNEEEEDLTDDDYDDDENWADIKTPIEEEAHEKLISYKRRIYNEIMDKCMSKDPDDRYSSDELLKLLNHLKNLK